jgi:catechol 2,3-dioxygenase
MTAALAKLGHVALSTPDLARSYEFFHDILGLERVEEHEGTVYLRGWGE